MRMNDPQKNDAPQEPAADAGLSQEAAAPSDPTPEAVKAMPIDAEEAAPEAAGDAPEDSPMAEDIAINEPSMEFSQAVPVPNDMMEAHRAEFPRFGDSAPPGKSRNMDLLLDVKLPVAIELGRTTLPIADILEWTQGTVIELDKLAGEPVDLLVNNKLVAKGEVVVVDEKFGLRITALIATPDAPVSA
jgi:flagellar motor switch protein FliN/FliY